MGIGVPELIRNSLKLFFANMILLWNPSSSEEGVKTKEVNVKKRAQHGSSVEG